MRWMPLTATFSTVTALGLTAMALPYPTNASAARPERHFIVFTTVGETIWSASADLIGSDGRSYHHWTYSGNANTERWYFTWAGDDGARVSIRMNNTPGTWTVPADSDFCVRLDAVGVVEAGRTGTDEPGCTNG